MSIFDARYLSGDSFSAWTAGIREWAQTSGLIAGPPKGSRRGANGRDDTEDDVTREGFASRIQVSEQPWRLAWPFPASRNSFNNNLPEQKSSLHHAFSWADRQRASNDPTDRISGHHAL